MYIKKIYRYMNDYFEGKQYYQNLSNETKIVGYSYMEANQERGNYTIEYLERLIKVFRKKIKLYGEKFRW